MTTPLPVRVDSRGKAWAILSARDFARMLPDHGTRTLRASVTRLSASRGPSPRDLLRDLCLTPDNSELVGILLRGDEHHQTDLYDITSVVADDPESAALRLRGRDAVQLVREPSPLPSWWTPSLPDSLRDLATDAGDVHGLLLLADWMPRYDPEERAIPDPTPDGTLRLDRPEESVGWAFLTGQPSASVRADTFAALRARAVANLRASLAALGGRCLGVALPSAKRRPWFLAPSDIAGAGADPFLDVSQVSWDALLADKSALDVPELMPHRGRGIVYRDPDTRVSTALHGAGFSVLATTSHGAPSVPATRGDASIAVVRSRRDAWAHAWDAPSVRADRAAARVAEALMTRGVPYAVVDEGALEDGRLQGFAAIVVAPTRGLSGGALEALARYVSAGRFVLAMESLPNVVDGAQSGALEGLIGRRRFRATTAEEPAVSKALASLLRRARIHPASGVYARPGGERARGARSLLTLGDADHVTYWHADESAASILLERVALRQAEAWAGDVWRPIDHWQADGSTYAELEAAPHTPRTVAFRHGPGGDTA